MTKIDAMTVASRLRNLSPSSYWPVGLRSWIEQAADEIELLHAANSAAMKLADARAIEANGLRAQLITNEAYRDTLAAVAKEREGEIDRLRAQLERVRNAGKQALRQWKMYAEMDDSEGFEKSAEGSVYLACESILTDNQLAEAIAEARRDTQQH